MTAINTEPRRNQELWRNAELRWSEDFELDLGPRVRAEFIAGIMLVATLIAIVMAMAIT